MVTIARCTASLLSGAILLVAGCVTSQGGSDPSIVDQVRLRISQEPRITVAKLQVREENGAVSVAGFLDSLEQQRLLGEILADVRNFDWVTSVEDATTTISSR